ncbi:hypothetical protein KIL84_008870 [Mauremys mutica]|uniref:Uncharacterized protein n=1 Tax=Mauremys mutica TaxID=74926 RepID=A0A9D3X3Q1_9SAUR|nr:hypothetical protein KIL84_008870 [Mauremys mutica]
MQTQAGLTFLLQLNGRKCVKPFLCITRISLSSCSLIVIFVSFPDAPEVGNSVNVFKDHVGIFTSIKICNHAHYWLASPLLAGASVFPSDSGQHSNWQLLVILPCRLKALPVGQAGGVSF